MFRVWMPITYFLYFSYDCIISPFGVILPSTLLSQSKTSLKSLAYSSSSEDKCWCVRMQAQCFLYIHRFLFTGILLFFSLLFVSFHLTKFHNIFVTSLAIFSSFSTTSKCYFKMFVSLSNNKKTGIHKNERPWNLVLKKHWTSISGVLLTSVPELQVGCIQYRQHKSILNYDKNK